jgi:ubiquinone/menaquinone biosynthesis C-methylase UbiE
MTPAEGANADQVAYWNESAGETWASLQDRLDRQLDGLGARAMAALAPQPGERVIDVGCGNGATSLALAQAVGPAGAVLGLDISRPMLAVARQRAAQAGLQQVEFREADAQTESLGAGGYDAVFSRFGVMFFADSAAAFANLRTALKPGGRLAFVCWRPLTENPWMTLPFAAAMKHLPALPEPPDPNAPGPFAFADPERVRAILAAAGFSAVAIRPHDDGIGGNGLDETVELALRVGPLGRALNDHPHLRPVVVDDIRAALAPHLTADGVKLPGAVWIVTAHNA